MSANMTAKKYALEEFSVCFASNECKSIYAKREHALIGISPFNSYYSVENIKKSILWAKNSFLKFHLFVPNELSCYTLLGLGYSEPEARRKVKRQDNYLLNKIMQAFAELSIGRKEAEKHTIRFKESLNTDSEYIRLLAKYKALYTRNETFKGICNTASREVLEANKWRAKGNGLAFDVAVNYIIYEMPLYLNTTNILDLPSSVFVYNKVPNYVKDLFDKRNFYVSTSQGYIGVEF